MPWKIAAVGLIETITAISDAIDALKAELATLFGQHPRRRITSFPGLGPVLGARLLGSLAMTRTVFSMLKVCAVSPPPPPSPARPGEAGWYPHDGSATGA
jgi:hypothetical protein